MPKQRFINEYPCQVKMLHCAGRTFSLVFLLFKDEHRVVEELLQFLVGVIDAELFERVELENLKTGHIQDSDEGSTLPLRSVQRPVDAAHQPAEHALETCFRYRLNGKLDLSTTHQFNVSLVPTAQVESMEI